MRKKWLRKVTAAALAAAMSISLCACSKPASVDSTEGGSGNSPTYSGMQDTSTEAPMEDVKFKDTINIAVSQEGATYDVHKTTTLTARQVFSGTVWEKLVTLNANAEVVPELCESYEMSEDAATFTFYLRKGVKFHDGTELTADDVVASMNRWIGAYSTAASLVGEGRFEKVDDYTVRIVCDSAALTLVDMMAGAAQPAIVTTAACCENEDENGYLKEYIGTGPYKFVEWVQGQYILLEKFEDYVPYYLEGSTEEIMDGWAGYKHAYTNHLKFWYVPEAATTIAGLQTGQFDVANVSYDNFDTVRGFGNEIVSEQGGITTAVFNKSEESIASNIYIRKAVNAAINCDDLMMSMFGDFYDLGSCYMDSTNAFWLTDAGSENYNQHDAELAKSYLEQAGYNGETFTILTSTLNHMDNLALVMEQELEAIGMNVEVSTCDWATFTQLRTDKTAFDAYITTFATVPTPTLKAYYGSSYPGWTADDTMTAKIAAFNEATTREGAYAAWEDLQAYSWDYLPAICVGHYGSAFTYNPAVKGLYFGNGMYYWNAYIVEE